jgi:hypothetical protein
MLRAMYASLLLTFISVSSVLAEKSAALDAKLTSLTSPVVMEAFDIPLAAPMAGVKGQWTVADGILVGKELAADKHAAVLNFQKKNHNSVVRFSFKVDGDTKGFNFSMNHAKGHLFRVVVTPLGLSLHLDKDKNDPQSKVAVLATAKGKFESGQWYTMQVEIVGQRVVAQTDNGLVVEGEHPSLDTDKPNYRFVMSGNSLAIDDLQIWEVN